MCHCDLALDRGQQRGESPGDPLTIVNDSIPARSMFAIWPLIEFIDIAGGNMEIRAEFSPFRGVNDLCVSLVLRRTLSGVASAAVAVLDDGQGAATVGTPEPADDYMVRCPTAAHLPHQAGKPISFAAVPLEEEETARLQTYDRQDTQGVWRAFRCRFEGGRTDRLVMRIQPDADEGRLLGFLSLIWPVLQEDCMQEITGSRSGIADDALLWMIMKKMDVAVFVVNQAGMMLRCNRAAKRVLDCGRILRRTRHGISCGNDFETRHMREAVAACANADPDHSDTVIFLSSNGGDQVAAGPKVPLTMCRFVYGGKPTSLVTLMLPSPPDARWIEILARERGLTQAEARVAALLQLGLSNRDAAQAAGLTEHTMNTYTKRVLGKLHVNSRAEMAQLLTWQAQGGPLA